MSFKSNTQPNCILCGRPIKKDVDTHWFTRRDPQGGVQFGGELAHRRHVVDKLPLTKAEAQPFVNQPIISAKRWNDKSIYAVNTWDGESYTDQFFDTGRCAQELGYAAALAGYRKRK